MLWVSTAHHQEVKWAWVEPMVADSNLRSAICQIQTLYLLMMGCWCLEHVEVPYFDKLRTNSASRLVIILIIIKFPALLTTKLTKHNYIIQGANQKFQDNFYKRWITSYMYIIYFILQNTFTHWSIHLFARFFNFLMPSRKAVLEMLLSSLVTGNWIYSTV
jgi:hypothetical protein